MISGSAKQAVESVVREGVPLRWLKKTSGSEDLDDLMAVDPLRLLTQHASHLHEIVKDGTSHLEARFGDLLPVEVGLQNSTPKRMAVWNVMGAFDSIVTYIMAWSKKMGYDTCRICLSDTGGQDVDPYTLTDPADVHNFYYKSTNPEFERAVLTWVAKEFVQRGLFTQSSAAQVIRSHVGP